MQITQRHNVYILVLSSVPRLYVFQRNSSPYVSKLSGGKPKRLPPVRPKRANTCTFSWPKQAESNNRSPPYRSAPPKSGRPQKRLQTRRSAHMVCAPKSDRRKQRLGQNKVRQQPPAFAASRDRPPIPRRPPDRKYVPLTAKVWRMVLPITALCNTPLYLLGGLSHPLSFTISPALQLFISAF